MSWRGRLLASAVVLPIAAVGLWLEHPWQHPARPMPPTSCRLPVYLSTSNTGGFLTVPGYAFTKASGNPFIEEAKSADHYWSYDAAIGRWLPVDYRMISLDGNWWVYATPLGSVTRSAPSAVHLVDRHGSDRIVWSGTGPAGPLGWTSSGAIFFHLAAEPQFQTEYWLVDPSTGTLRSLPSLPGEAFGIDASGTWGLSNELTVPAWDAKSPEHWTVVRTDIKSGASVTWWDQTIPALVIGMGFDRDHHPILRIASFSGDRERWVVLTSPHTQTEITGDAGAIKFSSMSALGDTHGVWFGDDGGAVWLWRPRPPEGRSTADPAGRVVRGRRGDRRTVPLARDRPLIDDRNGR